MFRVEYIAVINSDNREIDLELDDEPVRVAQKKKKSSRELLMELGD